MEPFELRRWRMSDLPALVEHANDAGVADNLMDSFPHPYTEQNGRDFLECRTAEDPAYVLAITVNDRACGAVGLHAQSDIYRHNMELGYWLAREHWGQGIMTRAVIYIVDYAFATFPEIDRVFARPFGRNSASQRVLEKAGFVLEASMRATMVKNGRVEDELIYARRRPK